MIELKNKCVAMVLVSLILSGCGAPKEADLFSRLSPEEANEFTLLHARLQEYERMAQPLKRVPITKSDFRLNNGRPEIRFTLKNETHHTLHQVQLRMEIYVPGETVPLLIEYLALAIPEGLLHRGEKEWSLTPSNNAQWRQLPALSQVNMKLEVESVSDPQGKPLYSVMNIGRHDRLRYLELQKKMSK